MNILVTITQPLDQYRKELLYSLKGGKYTDDHLFVVCSNYEKDYNVTTYEAFSELFDTITMCPCNIAPYDPDITNMSAYANEVVGFNYWRIPLKGETFYIPLGLCPAKDGWNKELRSAYRESGADFMGPIAGKDDEAWLDSYFLCDGDFLKTNPCVRGHRKDLMFMYRARNYTKRSVVKSDRALFIDVGLFTQVVKQEVIEEEVKPVEAPKPKKKAAKKRKAKKAASKKSSLKKARAKLEKKKETNTPNTTD